MIESGDVLRTWELAEEPAADRRIAAEPLADHRMAYLDYEGPVAGDRGEVTRWDAGTYELSSETDENLTVKLAGTRLFGQARLTRPDDLGQQWTFEYSH